VTAVLVLGSVMLLVACLLVLVRMTIGPTMLDRIIAFDVLVSVTVCALGLEAAINQHLYTLPALVALSLLGFVSSVSVASFTRGSDVVEEDR
jgi:multicomponent Na+:H+ antiporter subunit F